MENVKKELIQEKINTLKMWPGMPDSADKIFLSGVARGIEQMLAELEEKTNVVHGKWVDKTEYSYKCSVCGCNSFAYPFCPYCGARMDLK